MNTLALAAESDLEQCYAIIDSARNFQHEQGFVQWTEDYPNFDTIRMDIQLSKGYVVLVDGSIAGYMCIEFGEEPAYADIDGAWNAQAPYAVVHRMGFSEKYRGIGLADSTFRLIEELCVDHGIHYIRIDTDFPNKRMQHILTKNGYVHCGTIRFQGSGKMAYDKRF